MRNIDRTLFSKVDQTNAHRRHCKIRLAGYMPALKWPCKRITMDKYIIYNSYWGHRLCPIADNQFYTPSMVA